MTPARVAAVFGPTASGKSAVALALAERVGGEIVSCDAMQAYRGLPILTNQPSPVELARVPHHLVGMWPLDHAGSVAEFGALARAAIDDVLARGRLPIVAGGTGLYLRAALVELRLPPQPPAEARERFAALYDARGGPATHALLEERDPRAAALVHPNDRRRVVRALELQALGSSLAPPVDRLWDGGHRLPTAVFGLELPPAVVAGRIARRTRAMLERGVEEEVRRAREGGPLSHTAARIHGLQDVSALLDGAIDREEAIRRLEVRTRRYAKRQRTWMRKLPGLMAVAGDRPADEVASELAARL